MRGGGVCFELASMFERLLRSLGYRSTLVLGQVTFPGAHQAVVVELDEGKYLVDVGCGSPLYEPIPLDGEVIVRRLGLGYRFRHAERSDVGSRTALSKGSGRHSFAIACNPLMKKSGRRGINVTTCRAKAG